MNLVHNNRIWFLNLFFLLGFILIINSGCSGGGGSDSVSKSAPAISGVVQKGLYIDGEISAQKVDINGSIDTNSLSSTIGKDGKYTLAIPWSGLTLLSAEGHFFNEYTNKNSTQTITLYSLVDFNATTKVNLNLFTTLQQARVLTLMQAGDSYETALAKAKEALEENFGLSSNVDSASLDIFDTQSALKDENVNLLLLSGTFLKIAYAEDAQVKKSPARFAPSSKFQPKAMHRFVEDFKDGHLNGLFKADWQHMVIDDVDDMLAVVSGNLDIHREDDYHLPDDLWVTSILLDVSEPTYIFTHNHLSSIEYRLTIPQDNILNINNTYSISYATSNRTALSGTDYTSTSGTLDFSYFNNTKTITIPVIQRSSEAKIFELSLETQSETLSFTDSVLDVSIPSTSSYSEAGDLYIYSFKLQKVLINNNISVVPSNASIIPIGSSSSDVSLEFSFTSFKHSPINYNLNIYADSNSAEPLLIKENVFVPTVGMFGSWYTQGATIDVAVSSELRAYLQTAYDNNEDVIFRADIPMEDALVQKELTLPKLLQISDAMSPHTSIINARYIEPLTSTCQALSGTPNFSSTTQYASMNVVGEYLAIGANESVPVTYTAACIELTYDAVNKQFIPSLKDGIGELSRPIETTVGGNSVIVDADIDADSINVRSVTLQLPLGDSFHDIDDNGKMSTRGVNTITLQATATEYLKDKDLSHLHFNGYMGKYLHIQNLPFSFYINDYTLFDDRLELQSNSLRYAFAYANRHVNNGERFSKPLNQDNILSINANGVTGAELIHFNATLTSPSFPKSITRIGDFDIEIQESKIFTKQLASTADSVSFLYLQNCYSSTCSDTPMFNTLEINTSKTILYPDGSLVLHQEEGTVDVEWGDKGTDKTFIRHEDMNARVYLPGFELPTNNKELIGAYILGSAKATISDINHYSLASQTAKDGKYLFTGINLGDFEEADLSLAGNSMSVSLGDEQIVNTINSQYTKYYLRKSGVTGVFNNQDGEVLTPTVYGYVMHLNDFKFRQQNNKLDEYSKIAGSVKIPDKGNFDVLFENLALDCSGNFNGGQISPDQGDVLLEAWKTRSILTTIDFKSQPEGTCSNDKGLYLGHIIDVAALKNDVGLNTLWSFKGYPEAPTTILSATHNQLDSNATTDGYNIALRNLSFKSESTQNWIESDAAFGLPFWGISEMSMRLQNENNTSRKPSLVTAKGELLEAGAATLTNLQLTNNITEHYKQEVSQDWAGVIHFGLPIYYNSTTDAADIPSFLGRKLSADLIVLKADAGIDYVTPTATAMSFGASADFTKLKGFKLHVDLSDPNSLREIDESLEPYISIEKPLQNTIGVLLENLNIGNKLLKNGMNIAMEEAAMLALTQAGEDLGEEDPFEKLAQVNAKIYATPVVIRDRVLDIFESQILNVLNAHENDIQALGIALKEPVAQYYNLLEYLKDANSSVHAIPKISDLLGQTKKFIFKYGFGNQTCSWSNFSGEGFFKPIASATNSIVKVNRELQNFKIAKIENFAKKANKFTGLNSKDLVSTAEKVKELSDDFNSQVADLNTTLKNYFEDDFCVGFTEGMTAVDTLYSRIGIIDDYKTSLENNISVILSTYESDRVQEIIKKLEYIMNGAEPENFDTLKMNITEYIIYPIHANMDHIIDDIQSNIPNLQASDMRRMVVTKIFELPAVRDLNAKLTQTLDPLADSLNKLALKVFSGFDKSLNKLLAKVSDAVNKVLAKATSSLDKIPLATASMDGYATFYGDSLARLHVGSEFKITGKDKENSFGFNAALDVENDANNDKVGCSSSDASNSNLRAAISTNDITMPLGEKELKVDLLLLGVTIASDASLKGIFGAIESKSGFKYDTFELYNLGLATGIGVEETYLGAKANATMDDLQLGVSFLVGQVCNRDIVTMLVPKAINDFITIPNNKFNGALVFGEGQMPIWKNGCALTVNARAKLGTWFLFGPPKTYGGIVGGGAFGKALCIATLGGEVEVLAEKSGDVVKFQGSGWGAAGVGWCDNSWSSVSDSRSDSWCGTGDAQFGALYNNGWSLLDIRTSAVH